MFAIEWTQLQLDPHADKLRQNSALTFVKQISSDFSRFATYPNLEDISPIPYPLTFIGSLNNATLPTTMYFKLAATMFE